MRTVTPQQRLLLSAGSPEDGTALWQAWRTGGAQIPGTAGSEEWS